MSRRGPFDEGIWMVFKRKRFYLIFFHPLCLFFQLLKHVGSLDCPKSHHPDEQSQVCMCVCVRMWYRQKEQQRENRERGSMGGLEGWLSLPLFSNLCQGWQCQLQAVCVCVCVWTCSIVVKLTKSYFLFSIQKGINWCDTSNYQRAETSLLTVCPSKLPSELEPRPTESNNRCQ